MITQKEITTYDNYVEWLKHLRPDLDPMELYNPDLTYLENKTLARKKMNEEEITKKYYYKLGNAIKKVTQGYSKILFVKGTAGVGKSKQIRTVLNNDNAEFVELSGDISSAYLYRLLYENNGKIIWLKDFVKLLKMQDALNLLKAATESEDKCLLTKNNYSKVQEDLPDKFECNCKFIFDYNAIAIKGLQEDLNALQSRGDYIEVFFTKEEIINIMRLIATKTFEKEVTKHLIELIKKEVCVDINLRTQYKAFKTYNFCKQNDLDWKKELKSELKVSSRERVLLHSLIGTKDITTTELKKILIKKGIVNTIRTSERFIKKMLFIEELFKVSEEQRNYSVNINRRS